MAWQDVRSFYEDGPDEPVWKTLSDSHHTARTPKQCEICEGRIEPGQRYHKVVALDDGDFRLIVEHDDRDECRAAGEARRKWEDEMIAQQYTGFDETEVTDYADQMAADRQ